MVTSFGKERLSCTWFSIKFSPREAFGLGNFVLDTFVLTHGLMFCISFFCTSVKNETYYGMTSSVGLAGLCRQDTDRIVSCRTYHLFFWLLVYYDERKRKMPMIGFQGQNTSRQNKDQTIGAKKIKLHIHKIFMPMEDAYSSSRSTVNSQGRK
jgi:hypothetical protein